MQKGFGLIIIVIAIAIIALLATWQITGQKNSGGKQGTKGLIETEQKAKVDIGTINEQLKQQYPTDTLAP